ncbi:MAG: GatB/YqeY domain-containing protein [Deltaproteobacteria bacterium]|nr:MAG: GatB/YqeY domain-containing protein [Deltaproteobacteria bacterium]
MRPEESLLNRINKDLKKAMKEKDAVRLSCLRMLKTAIKRLQVEKTRELKDDEIVGIIQSLIKKGKEAVEDFKKGGRNDLAEKEEKEIGIFYEYLPKQLTFQEMEKIVQEVISELKATSIKDLGKVMKKAMARIGGRAQGKDVSEVAKRLLSN